MGAGMAVTGKLAAGALLLCLAACGNDSETRFDLKKLGIGMPGRAPAAAPVALTPEVLRRSPLPLMEVAVEQDGRRSVMARIVQRAGVETFSSSDDVTVTLRNGVLEQTRGLGRDLMSSMQGSGARPGHAAGQWSRSWQVLGADDAVVTLTLACAARSAGVQPINLDGQVFTVTRWDERCTGHGIEVTNQFYTGSDGMIRQSKQWLGPDAGYLLLKRPGG